MKCVFRGIGVKCYCKLMRAICSIIGHVGRESIHVASTNVRERIVTRSEISPGPLYVFVFIKRWRNYGPGDYTVTHVTYFVCFLCLNRDMYCFPHYFSCHSCHFCSQHLDQLYALHRANWVKRAGTVIYKIK